MKRCAQLELRFLLFLTLCLKASGQTQVTCGTATCAVGSYCANAAFNICGACPPGSELTSANAVDSTKAGVTKCTVCPQGKTSTSGSSSCTICAAGKYTEDATFHNTLFTFVQLCTNCPIGTFNTDTGTPVDTDHDDASDCLNCVAGKTSTQVTGSTSCSVCTAGKYRTLGTIGLACALCPSGSYLADLGSNAGAHLLATQCLACAVGQYNSLNTGAANCIDCPVGRYNDDQATAAAAHQTCTNCPVGKFNNTVGSTTVTSCAFCPDGKKPTASQNVCSSCIAGTYNPSSSSNAGQGICYICPGGWYNVAPGHYVATKANLYDTDDMRSALHLSCTKCVAGEYLAASSNAVDHSVVCTSCPIGKYSDSSTQTDGTGAAMCSICAAGTYSDALGSYPCKICPSGKYLPDTATNVLLHNQASDCLLCVKGTFLSNGDDSSQLVASAHTSVDDCAQCGVGKYTDQNGQATCKVCTAGRAHNLVAQDAATNCLLCAIGRYTGQQGQSACTACPIGFVQPTTGRPSCDSCATGKAEFNNSRLSCADCPVAKYQDSTGNNDCKNCPSGTYNAVEQGRTSSCKQCPAGYKGTSNTLSCDGCTATTYQSNLGRDLCETCPSGYYQAEKNQSMCNACPTGWKEVGNLLSCAGCGATLFQDEHGQDSCTKHHGSNKMFGL